MQAIPSAFTKGGQTQGFPQGTGGAAPDALTPREMEEGYPVPADYIFLAWITLKAAKRGLRGRGRRGRCPRAACPGFGHAGEAAWRKRKEEGGV